MIYYPDGNPAENGLLITPQMIEESNLDGLGHEVHTMDGAIAIISDEILWFAALLICIPKCRGDQVGTGISGNSVPNDLTRIKIENNAEVDPVAADIKVSNVTHPDLIRMIGDKLSCQQVLFLILLAFFILLFRTGANALQIQLLHDGRDSFGTYMNTGLSQNRSDFFGAKSLLAFIKYLLYFYHQFFLFFLSFATIGTAEDISYVLDTTIIVCLHS